MILRAEDPNQMFFTSRAELVRSEDLVRTVDEVVNQLDLAALCSWKAPRVVDLGSLARRTEDERKTPSPRR